MEVDDRSKTEGIIEMPTTILDPLETRGSQAVLETGNPSLTRNVGIVARKCCKRNDSDKSGSGKDEHGNR